MQKRITFTLFVVCAIIFASVASNTQDKRQTRNDYRQLGLDIKEFAKKEIIPVMSVWKQGFDKSISADDLKKLEALRIKAKEIKQNLFTEMKAIRQKRDTTNKSDSSKMMEMRERVKKGLGNTPKPATPETMKQKRQHPGNTERNNVQELRMEAKNKMEAVVVELMPIIEKNKDKLQVLKPDMETKGKEWKERIVKIIDDWKAAQASDSAATGRKMNRLNPGRFLSNKDFNKKRFLVKFLLWDGNSNELDDEFGTNTNMLESSDVMGMGIDINTPLNLKNAPNPFKEKTVITFYLPETQTLKIRVTDAVGKEIAILHDGELKAGNQSFTFEAKSITGLVPGAYFLTIEGKNLKKSLSMMFE